MRGLHEAIVMLTREFDEFYSQEGKVKRAREKLLTGVCSKDLIGETNEYRFTTQAETSLVCSYTSKNKTEWVYSFYYPHLYLNMHTSVMLKRAGYYGYLSGLSALFNELSDDKSFTLVGVTDDLRLYFSNQSHLLIGISLDGIIDLYMMLPCERIYNCTIEDDCIVLDIEFSRNNYKQVRLNKNNYHLIRS